jgi:hypothetical protein
MLALVVLAAAWESFDRDASRPPSVQNAPPPACSDRGDNDQDGKTDYPADPGCTSSEDPAERLPSCSDGRDNDQDGKTDYPADPDCTSPEDPAERQPSCSDGRDNDQDGKTDYPADPDCTSPEDLIEKQRRAR